jgi:hypothetical protein
MNRVFLAAAVLGALPLICRAEERVVRLKIRPMPAPKPALQYLLLPEVRELTPGNPAQWYMRCFAEQRLFFFGKQGVAERGRYLSMSLVELREAKVHRYGGSALEQADWAARLNALDWQVLERVQEDGLNLQLPELGPLRILAKALKARFRIEVARGQFEDAVRTAKTMFALARHLGESAAPAANQTGLFVAHLALDTLEEMVQQPGCPNLYWALTDLPCPLVDLRKGFQGNRSLTAKELQPLREDAVMTAEELEKVVSRLSGAMGYTRMKAGQPLHNLEAGLATRTKDAERVRAIRDRLLQSHRTALANRMRDRGSARDFFNRLLDMSSAKELIQQFPTLQVILLDAKREFEIQSDERMKLLALAPWQIDKLGGEELERSDDCLLADFLPPVVQARREQARLQQRIALLRHIEALRLHAAEHEGKPPEKLADLAVPLPDDPFTGKPFVYRVEAATAYLNGNPPRGEEKNAAYNIRYEATLQK